MKAFKLSEIKQITHDISRPMGFLWLITFLVFVVSAILFLSTNKYWWLSAIIAILISQFIIINFWHDAKFGTIANIFILILALTNMANWNYYEKFQTDVNTELRKNSSLQTPILTEADLFGLPDQVKNYMRYTGSIGKPQVNNFKVTTEGKIRKNEKSEWMPFTTEQYNFLQQSSRLFFMNARMNQLPVSGYHSYKYGKAIMDIRLLSTFKVQYQDGSEMDIAETVTFFNDMCCMAPATLIDKRIKWGETNGEKVQASFTNNNITITAWLFFNDKSELVNFISNDRYNYDAKKKLPWSTPLSEYKDMNGYRLATIADAIYQYPEKEICYGKFHLTNIEYNLNRTKN